MKAIFLCLLLINAVLLALILVTPDKAVPARSGPADIDAPTIELLAEKVDAQVEPVAEIDREPPSRLSLPPVAESSAASGVAAADRGQNALCTLLGPFDQLLQAEYTVEHLASLGVNGAVESLEIPGDPGFWVFLSPFPSRKEALRKLQELQAKGIDSYVIPKGDIVNGISFGMYSRERSAKVRQREVADFGYQADIKRVIRSYEEIWVVVSPDEAEKMNDLEWQSFMNARKEVERRENYCPGVASL